MKPSRSTYLDIRGLRYHVREWGVIGAPKVFMLHGWMDVSASFQFLVDALQGDWHVIAPDWRGFGLSARGGGDSYWFPDYLADIDAIAREYSADEPLRMLGHSMGGNLACLYAGVRPSRVTHVVALDAFGLADRPPAEAPGRYEKWLDELREPQAFRSYADFAELASRLRKDNPRLGDEQALFLARALGREEASGRVASLGDPAHRRVNPVLYRRAEALACWRRVRAAVLWLIPEEPSMRRKLGVSDADNDSGKACFRDFREIVVHDAGHNLHHDQPAFVARALEFFLRD